MNYQFRSHWIGQPCPRDCFVIGMHCVVTGPGNDTEHWTKPCPWAVGSSSSRGWTREPSGCEGTGIREAAINLPSAAAGSGLRHTTLPKLHFAFLASPALADSLLLLFNMFRMLLYLCFFLRSVLLPSPFSLSLCFFVLHFYYFLLALFPLTLSYLLHPCLRHLLFCSHPFLTFFVFFHTLSWCIYFCSTFALFSSLLFSSLLFSSLLSASTLYVFNLFNFRFPPCL